MKVETIPLSMIRYWSKELENPRELCDLGIEVWAVALGDAHSNKLVSNMGRFGVKIGDVLSIQRGSQSSTGYILYSLDSGNNRKSMVANRIVLYTFDGSPPSKVHTDAGHLGEGCKTDNRISNLAWQTRSENMLAVGAAKRRGQAASRTTVAPVSNPTYSLSEDSVKLGLNLIESGQLRISDLAKLWAVSEDVVRSIIEGKTWAHLKRNDPSRSRREGEENHKVVALDDEVETALELYEEFKWTAQQLADHLGMSVAGARNLISGRTRRSATQSGISARTTDRIRRGSDHGMAKITEKQVREAFDAFMRDEVRNLTEISNLLGLSTIATREIMNGQKWTIVPRPEGLEEKWRATLRFRLTTAQRESLVELIKVGKTNEEVANIIGCEVKHVAPYRTAARKSGFIP